MGDLITTNYGGGVVLDDLKRIEQLDTQDSIGVVAAQFQQLLHNFDIKVDSSKKIEKVVVAGMGGSALAATFAGCWPKLKVPFEIVRDYHLPEWVGQATLVVVSSYSGNTEETLSALEEAKNRKAQIAVISAGGKLEQAAKEHGYPYCELPDGLQPRMAPFYSFKALLSLLEIYSLARDVVKEIELIAQKMSNVTKAWLPTVPTDQNQAKQLAEHMAGKTPIIYGAKLYPAAYKWKINFNENAKNTAWCNQLPEFNHNEFLGWTSHPIEKPFAVIDLISSFDNEQVKKRFDVSDKLLSGKRPKAIQIQAEGDNLIEQLLWVIALGDMASLYLAVLNGLNPTPVDLIEKLKKELSS